MKDIEIITFEKISKKSFRATGRIGEKTFEAKTIVHKGNPIFKIYEDGVVKKTTDPSSKFSLGERMSIASFLKKYAKGKIDKEGRPVDNQRNPGIGITIQLQNKIDDLLLENKRLKQLLEENEIQFCFDYEEADE
tara:strand:- start:331 stop:735 length:405 start_codon:yes stop_codon:yes gene_type:complete